MTRACVALDAARLGGQNRDMSDRFSNMGAIMAKRVDRAAQTYMADKGLLAGPDEAFSAGAAYAFRAAAECRIGGVAPWLRACAEHVEGA